MFRRLKGLLVGLGDTLEYYRRTRPPVRPPNPEGVVRPPWVEFPGTTPIWGGWRQGDGEAWLLCVFSPFWRALKPEEREAFLQQWPPPDEDWREYITRKWV